MLKGRDGGTVVVVMPESEHGQLPGGTLDPHEVSFSSPCFRWHAAEEFDVSGVLDDVPEGAGIQDLHIQVTFTANTSRRPTSLMGAWGVGQNLAVSSSKNPCPMIWAALLVGKGVYQLLSWTLDPLHILHNFFVTWGFREPHFGASHPTLMFFLQL